MGADGTGPAGPGWLDERLRSGRVVLLDGATGSELEARGAVMHEVAWCAPATLTAPDTLRAVHEDYILAGARVIIANTFSAARHVLEPAGFGERVAEINRRAVEIAREARDAAAAEPVAIAGSMSSHMADSHDPFWLAPERLRATYREQAQALAEAGVELIVLEMMERAELAVPAIEEALATGLPVWVGVSARVRADGGIGCFDFPGRDLEDTLEVVCRPGVGLVAVMHSAVPDTGPALETLRGRWPGPVGAYPESGFFESPHWRFVDVIDPGELAREALTWAEAGAQVIGGCCGTGPAHVRALREALAARL